MTDINVTLVIGVMQILGIVFAAGIVWNRLNSIERRLDRIERWINSDTNSNGDRLEQ